MKKYLAEIIALILSMNAMSALEGAESALPPLGQEIVSQVESEYKDGRYNNFLDQLHGQYQAAGKVGAIRSLFQNTNKASGETSTFDGFGKQQEEEIKLDQIRNQRLLEAISESSDGEIARRVESIVTFSQSPEQKKVLIELDQLKYHIPEGLNFTLKDKIGAIETEYYLKSLLLDIAHLRFNPSLEEKYKKKIVLSLEKFKKMEATVNASNDSEWKDKLQRIKDAYYDHLAFRVDLESLNDLAKGKIQPHNATEEKVKTIVADFLKQKNTFKK